VTVNGRRRQGFMELLADRDPYEASGSSIPSWIG